MIKPKSLSVRTSGAPRGTFMCFCLRPLAALCLIAAALLSDLVRGAVELPDNFAHHMVVQRGAGIPVWGRARPGEKVAVALAGKTASTVASAGGDWSVTLPPLPAGGPFTLSVRGENLFELKDVMVGDVWLCSGQSNMDFRMSPVPPWTAGVLDCESEIAAAKHPKIRFFTVTQESLHYEKHEINGVWQTCTPEDAGKFSAVAYYFARKLQPEAGVPVGMIVSAMGGTSIGSWLDRETLQQFQAMVWELSAQEKMIAEKGAEVDAFIAALPAYRAAAKEGQMTTGKLTPFQQPYENYLFKPGYCYNAMIAPLTRIPIKGVLWYQGEADAQWASGYAGYMRALIANWRAKWSEPQLPFLYVQLAGYDPVRKTNADPMVFTDVWAELREAQALVLDVPATGMATAADVGEALDIHPRNKKPVGERLALIALAQVYGKSVVSSGPQYASKRSCGAELVLLFDALGSGLAGGNGGPGLAGFEVCGTDGIYHPAASRIDGDTVVLSSPEVQEPVDARYGWGNVPVMTLYNRERLPAPPFRTNRKSQPAATTGQGLPASKSMESATPPSMPAPPGTIPPK